MNNADFLIKGDMYQYNLGWLIGQISEINRKYNEILEKTEKDNVDYEEIKSELAEIKKELDDYVNGKLITEYLKATQDFIDKNLISFVSEIVKYVVFGISDDGHFVAYIPASWEFVNFDTVVDETSELYGHLLLKW